MCIYSAATDSDTARYNPIRINLALHRQKIGYLSHCWNFFEQLSLPIQRNPHSLSISLRR